MDEVTVTMRPTEALSEREKAEVIDLCIAAHGVEDFRNLFVHIPSGGRHVLVRRGDELVSHAVATTRWAQPEGHQVLRTAYVDAVSTHPACEGQGLGSAAMRRLAAEIDDYELACLQTDRWGFYERLGWELWRGPLAGRDSDALVPTPDQEGVMILRIARTPALDLDALLTIECQQYRIWE